MVLLVGEAYSSDIPHSCRNVVTLKNVSSPTCTTAAEAMEVLRQVSIVAIGYVTAQALILQAEHVNQTCKK